MTYDSQLVSIIIPTFNSEKTIRDTIESVLRQSYKNFEVIIIDDSSSDRTVDICKWYSLQDKRIKFFINDDNYGAGFSRNAGISQANGRFIAFLDSDDIWHKDKLEKQISFMLINNYAFTYTGYQKITSSGELLSEIHPINRVNYSELLKSNVIGCLTAVYDTSVLGKMYMPTIRKRQDMALWLSILEKIDFAYCLSGVYAYYREGSNTLSSNKFKIIFSQWDFYRKYLKFGVIRSSYYFFHYLMKAFIKHKVKG
ncbi:glycosyltransferase family 2 protein [Edwardsiella tarda]|uniref:glycosyltransferase family 2 protein n=1 Tax=Edwardsiella tarda TaxID=636 RepID=UPI003B501A1A